MGSQTKLQTFPYSLRTIAASEDSTGLICGYRFFLYMLPPKDALTIEALHCHFVFQFAAGIASADRRILSIGVVDELPPPINQNSGYQRRQELNIDADVNRRIDVSLDLTHLLNKDNVSYAEQAFDDGPDDGFTAVEVLLPSSISESALTGVVELWKLDGLYTTAGIR